MKRRFKTPGELNTAWEAYKQHCDNRMVLTHSFNGKTGEYVSKELKKAVTYTISGFCLFAGLSRQAFQRNYADAEPFRDTVALMKETCEVDAREKFELGVIPSKLAGLWMSNYGYGMKPGSQGEDDNSGLDWLADFFNTAN